MLCAVQREVMANKNEKERIFIVMVRQIFM